MVYKSKLPAIDEPKTGIIQFIFSNKNNTPEDKPVLIDAIDNRFITYAQLKDYVLRFGAGLQDICGFKTDDVLALYAHNMVKNSLMMTSINTKINMSEFLVQLLRTSSWCSCSQ